MSELEIIELYMVIYHWFKSFTLKPSSVPSDYYQRYLNIHEEPEICSQCQCNKYPRTHHCTICGQCVVRYDHHCSWLGCIGLHNIRHFHLILMHTGFLLSIYLFYIIRDFVIDRSHPEFSFKGHVIIGLVLVNLWIAITVNFLFQTLLITFNLTSIDFINYINGMMRSKKCFKPQYYMSFVENWREAYLVRDDLSIFWYFLPYTPTYRPVNQNGSEKLDSIVLDV